MKTRRFSNFIAALPQIRCIDVGASYYPHTSWWLFLSSPRTRWVAVEPNEANLTYVHLWPWPAQVCVVPNGLSGDGGKKILYVTNADSGSSLLKPIIPESMKLRSDQALQDYFYPMQTTEIDTITLLDVVGSDLTTPILIKLDTQGSELSILENLLNSDQNFPLVGVETECSLLADPYYRDSPRLWNLCSRMEESGFETLMIEVFPRSRNLKKISNNPRELVTECDVVFALKPDIAAQKSLEVRAALLGFYITNCLFREALILLSNDSKLSDFLRSRSCDTWTLRSELNGRLKSRKI